MNYFAEVLKRNAGRTKIQSDRRELCSDGPMLNVLSVLQHLSFKVKLDKIDSFYPFHPQSLVDLKNDTRIKGDTKELDDWVASLCECIFFYNIVIFTITLLHFYHSRGQ